MLVVRAIAYFIDCHREATHAWLSKEASAQQIARDRYETFPPQISSFRRARCRAVISPECGLDNR